MRSDLTAGTLLSAILWSMLLLSLFAAPALMAARGTDVDPDPHTLDLIRQHQEATSLIAPAPEPKAQAPFAACQEPEGAAAREQEKAAAGRGIAPEDEPMIRPVGTRAKRIRV
jgi:hypothetical protein